MSKTTETEFPKPITETRSHHKGAVSETDVTLSMAELLAKYEGTLDKYERKLEERSAFETLRRDHERAPPEQREANAQWLRDASHADDSIPQRGVRWVEEIGVVRKYVIPAGKVAGGVYVTYKGVRLAWAGAKYVKNWVMG
jgi:hypothetical protein